MERNQLTDGQLEALHVLAIGMASRSVRTANEPERGVRCIQGSMARDLISMKLARVVTHWNAVEITESGRRLLVSGRT